MCASGPEHLILIDRSGAAWSWGRGPQTGRIKVGAEEEDEIGGGLIALTRIDFFQVYIGEEGSALFRESVMIYHRVSGPENNISVVRRPVQRRLGRADLPEDGLGFFEVAASRQS